MINPTKSEEVSVFRRFVPKIGFKIGFGVALVFAIIPAIARAQVNIDQGKPAADIFQNDCATCHKTARGLADGKNSLMLSSFLREHYTASRDQAAALAAYVLGAGGSAPAPAQKPGQEHAKATGEEPKSAEPKTVEPKTVEPKIAEPKIAEPKIAEPKTAARPEQEAKPEEQEHPAAESGAAGTQRSNSGKRDARPVTASRGHKQEPGVPTPAQQAAPVLATPAANATPSSAEAPSPEGGTTKSAAAPAESQPGDSAPVPRDNIPD
jgi:outer membrane biosynthesis protein TonB